MSAGLWMYFWDSADWVPGAPPDPARPDSSFLLQRLGSGVASVLGLLR